MKRGLIITLSCLLALTVWAGINLIRDPETRPVEPHWSALGDPQYPFSALYVDTIWLNGVLLTNGGGGGGGVPVVFTNTVTLPPGNAAYCVNYGSVAGYWQLGLPQGATGPVGTNGTPGTNYVTSAVYSNVCYSTTETLITNVGTINFTGSNFIGSFNNIYTYDLETPTVVGGGVSPGSNALEYLIFSTNGGTIWFTNNNLPVALWLTNVLVAVVGDVTTTNAGSLILYGVDFPQYYGRTNGHFGQVDLYDNPTQGQQAATKSYVDTSVANAMVQGWTTSTDTNGVRHFGYAQGTTIFDITGQNLATHINNFTLSGTNFLLTATLTNFYAGWQLQSETNIALTYGWAQYTNYTLATNSGVVTFTIPRVSFGNVFFRLVSPQTPGITAYAPLTVTFYVTSPSNSWAVNYANVTSTLPNFQFANFVNSNGWAQFKVWRSNNAFYTYPQ